MGKIDDFNNFKEEQCDILNFQNIAPSPSTPIIIFEKTINTPFDSFYLQKNNKFHNSTRLIVWLCVLLCYDNWKSGSQAMVSIKSICKEGNETRLWQCLCNYRILFAWLQLLALEYPDSKVTALVPTDTSLLGTTSRFPGSQYLASLDIALSVPWILG